MSLNVIVYSWKEAWQNAEPQSITLMDVSKKDSGGIGVLLAGALVLGDVVQL